MLICICRHRVGRSLDVHSVAKLALGGCLPFQLQGGLSYEIDLHLEGRNNVALGLLV